MKLICCQLSSCHYQTQSLDVIIASLLMTNNSDSILILSEIAYTVKTTSSIHDIELWYILYQFYLQISKKIVLQNYVDTESSWFLKA